MQAIPISGLKGEYRGGQVFLQWKENDVPTNATLNVYRHSMPITEATLSQAIKIGHHVQPHSATDWWQNPNSFNESKPSAAPVGFVIRTGAQALDPNDGLFVHTVLPEEGRSQYYAVTTADSNGRESLTILPGKNTLSAPVAQEVAPVQAIWTGPANPPHVQPGLPLLVKLHSGSGGADTNYPWLVFGDASLGWREGLPFKFSFMTNQYVLALYPSDRAWFTRVLRPGFGMACVAAFFGYNSHVYDAKLMASGVIVNYHEKRVMWLIDWAHRTLKTDPNQVHLQGSSMGAIGLMLALHFPDAFASVVAGVPCVSYMKSNQSAPGVSDDLYVKIMTIQCGALDGSIPFAPGLPGADYMDGAACLNKAKDLPFIAVYNGRQDRPTPWYKNPPFYRALNERRFGCMICWNNGEHGPALAQTPDDFRKMINHDNFKRFKRNESFPAFSNCSDNKNPGTGDPADGDIIGWFNRGLDWEAVTDTADQYAITLFMSYPGIAYPVTVDMTPRRVQRFKPKPHQALKVTIGASENRNIRVDEQGLFTVTGIRISSADKIRVNISP